MDDGTEDFVKAMIGILCAVAWIVNVVKLFATALNDQIGVAIVHAVGLLGPMALITVWF